jgi:hypothetical protein
MGVGLCLLMVIWFLSGIVMMYVSFPTVTDADRLQRMPALDPDRVVLSPAAAAARVGFDATALDIRLNTFDTRPVYRFVDRATGTTRMIYADTGDEQLAASDELRHRIASAWSQRPIAQAVIQSVEAVDQWTVQAPLRSLRPLWKYSWPSGEHVYVAGVSGEVVQSTTSASRLAAYLGPIPHWLYFTPLRARQATWRYVVTWSAGAATVLTVVGFVIATSVLAGRRTSANAGSRLPYQGRKRLHMVLGLSFGVTTATWAFSGLLSMDPFPQPEDRGARRDRELISAALRGAVAVDRLAAVHPAAALARLRALDVRELELTSFAGAPHYLATLRGGLTQAVTPDGTLIEPFDRSHIAQIVQGAFAGYTIDTRVVEEYDRYYLDRTRRKPLPVILVLLNDANRTRYYVDPRTGRVVESFSNQDQVDRWLYAGLHSLNFPWLYNHRPVWDIVVITCMVGGAALSVTSVMLAWRVVRRKVGSV